MYLYLASSFGKIVGEEEEVQLLSILGAWAITEKVHGFNKRMLIFYFIDYWPQKSPDPD